MSMRAIIATAIVAVAATAAVMYDYGNDKPETPADSGLRHAEDLRGNLPGVPSPQNRTNDAQERRIQATCYIYSDAPYQLIKARRAGEGRAAQEAYATTFNPSTTQGGRIIHQHLMAHFVEVTWNGSYTYTDEQLNNYAYQYCDLYLHEIGFATERWDEKYNP